MEENEFKVKEMNEVEIVLEEEEDDDKHGILFLFFRRHGGKLYMALLVLAFLLLSVSIGVALRTIYDNSNDIYEPITSDFYITYHDVDGSRIDIINGYPMTDNEGMALDPYLFGIKSTGEVNIQYRIKIVEDDFSDSYLEKDRLIPNRLKYSIKDEEGNLLKKGSLGDSKDNIIYEGVIKAPDTEDFKLNLWMNENAQIDMQNKIFSGRIVVEYVQYLTE